MMKDGVCPMCRFPEIYTTDSTFRAAGQIVRLAMPSGEKEFRPYVCTNCGFTAMYIDEAADLAAVRKDKDWKKVTE